MDGRSRPHSKGVVVISMLATAALLAACSSSPNNSAGSPSAAATTAYPVPSGGNGGSTDTGVSGDAINLALLYSITGPAPGATAGSLRGANAYAAYINSQGGIYGRKLKITPFDNGFDPTKAQAACTQIIPNYFAVTGGFALGDQSCAPLVTKSNLPWFQFSYDPEFSTVPNYFFPGVGDPHKVPTVSAVALKQAFPDVTKVAAVYEDSPGNLQQLQHFQPAFEAAGFKYALTMPVSSSAASFANYVVKIRQSGAQAVLMDQASAITQSRLAQAMAQQGFKPAFAQASSSYGSDWHQQAGAGAAGWTSELSFLPYLDKSAMTATPGGQNFLTWFDKVNKGKPLDLFAIFGWVSTELLAQAIIKAGPALTRNAVLESAKTITSFDADGLYAPADIAQKAYSTCTILMQSTSSGYKQLLPTKPGFACDLPGAGVIDSPSHQS
jgi:branched-chain amino acid transport system substrate-binding protein